MWQFLPRCPVYAEQRFKLLITVANEFAGEIGEKINLRVGPVEIELEQREETSSVAPVCRKKRRHTFSRPILLELV